MAHKSRIDRTLFCSLKSRHVLITAVVASAALNPAQSAAQAPTVTLTQIGSPIWRPVDFQLFSAPREPDAGAATFRALEPLQPLGPGEPYTTPHGPPYDNELSTNAAAAGFVNRSVFPRNAITNDPNAIFFAYLQLPDPGITGSSRDFASGPVIPNSLFPIATSGDVWKDGAVIFVYEESSSMVRPTDLPFDGASHRLRGQNYWNRGANNLGNYEFHRSLRDAEANGWDIVVPFKVVRAGDFDEDGDVDPDDLPRWTSGFGASSGAMHADGDSDFDGDVDGTDFLAWQRELGQASSLPATSTIPEPSALASGCIAACGLAAAARRKARKGGLPCAA